MGFPAARTGFCGCTLKTSALFASWFSLLVSFLCLLTVAYSGSAAMEQFAQEPTGSAMTAYQMAELIMITALVISATCIILLVFTIIGIYKEQPCLMFPYVCVKSGILSLALLGFLQMVLKGQFSQQFVGGLCFLVLEGYFVFIIYSHIQELKERRLLNSVYNRQIVPNDSFAKGNFA